MNNSVTPIGDEVIAKWTYRFALALLAFCILMIVVCLFSSCTIGYSDDIVDGTYKRSRNLLIQGPGGTASQKGSNGYSLVTDNQQSARDIGTAIGGGYAAHQAQLTNASNNLKDVRIGNQGVQNNAILHPTTTTTQSVDPVTGTVLTNSVQTVPFPTAPVHK